jgi:hypothetical protein
LKIFELVQRSKRKFTILPLTFLRLTKIETGVKTAAAVLNPLSTRGVLITAKEMFTDKRYKSNDINRLSLDFCDFF